MPEALSAIGIDGSRLTAQPRTGTENYSVRLLRAMAELAPSEPIQVYLNAASASGLDIPGEPVCIPAQRFWTQGRLAFEMLRKPPGVLFVPSHVAPLVHPKTVITVHDAGYLEFPATYTASERRRLDWSTRWSLRAAAAVIVPSESTRTDLIDRYGVAPGMISVIPHGVEPDRGPAPGESDEQVLQRLGLTRPFVLSVGTGQPRKNFAGLIRAFGAVTDAELPHELVIAGQRGQLAGETEMALAESPWCERIHLPGYVSDSTLATLYRTADLFCLVSLHEGFGMPVLEAMAAGTPVITSDRSSLPEVAGDAALKVDPTDTIALGEAIIRILRDPVLAGQLKQAGLQRAAHFTWRHSALATLSLLRRIRDTGTSTLD